MPNRRIRPFIDTAVVTALLGAGAFAGLLVEDLGRGAELAIAGLLVLLAVAFAILGLRRATGRAGVARVVAADAAAAGAVLLGVAGVRQGLGGLETLFLAAALAAGAGLSALILGPRIPRLGARHVFDVAVLVLALPVLLLALEQFLDLPALVLLPIGAVMGAAIAGIWASDDAWQEKEHSASGRVSVPVHGSALVGPLAWAVVALLGQPLAWVFAVLAIQTVAAFVLMRGVKDPHGRNFSPLGPYLPWRDPDGTPQPWPAHAWARWSGHGVYIVGATILFLRIPRDAAALSEQYAALVYEIPELFNEFPAVILQLFTTVWFNYHPIQLVYVLSLLVLFGVWYEIREGTWRAVLVFFGTSLVAGVVAGALLHALHATMDAAWIDDAWRSVWSGGSAGAFGLMGALAARAPRPWLLLAVFVFWEINVEVWFLQSYTVAFHMAALAAGFLLARYVIRPRDVEGRASWWPLSRWAARRTKTRASGPSATPAHFARSRRTRA